MNHGEDTADPRDCPRCCQICVVVVRCQTVFTQCCSTFFDLREYNKIVNIYFSCTEGVNASFSL